MEGSGPWSVPVFHRLEASYVGPSSTSVFQRCGIRWRDSGRLSGLSKHMSGFDGNESVGNGGIPEGRQVDRAKGGLVTPETVGS